MTQYIDKSALVAEIKRRMDEEVNYDEDSKDFASYVDFTHYSTLDTLLDFIDTLEVKEVDLEDKGEWKNTGGFGSTCDPDSTDYCPD